MNGGGTLTFTTEQGAGHVHRLVLAKSGENQFLIKSCDSNDSGKRRCWDQHDRFVNLVPNQ